MTRADYLDLWRELFIIFGDSREEIALQEEILRNAHAKSNRLEDVAAFLNEMTSAIRKLETRGEETYDKYINCWGLITTQVREWFDKFVSDKDRSYFDKYGSCARTYYLSNPKEKFEKFRDYIYHAEKEYAKSETIKMGLFKSVLRGNESPRKEEKKEEKPKERDNRRNERSDDKKESSRDEKNKRRGRSNERHVSTEPERKRRRDEDCFICKKPHDWVNCPKDIDEKLAIFTKYNLCKNCGKEGHVPRDCRTRVRCYHCKHDSTKQDYQKRHHSSICTFKYGQPKYPIRYTNQPSLAKDDLRRRTMNRYLENVPSRDKRNPTPPALWNYTRLPSPPRSRNQNRTDYHDRRQRHRSRSPRRRDSRSPRRRDSRSPRRRSSRSPKRNQRSRRTPDLEKEYKKKIADLERRLKEEAEKNKKVHEADKEKDKKI
jgi:hypothetical protein